MKPSDIILHRLHNQQLIRTDLTTPQEIVAHMGAVQAQDYDMSLWAVGVRLPGSARSQVEEAIDQGNIIRTHILRPTWHLVAAQDIHWMLELTAPHVHTTAASYNRQLGLDDKLLKRTGTLIEKALQKNGHLTREELMDMLERAKISTEGLRPAHIMLDAELKGIVCNGTRRDGKHHTYALLQERVPPAAKMQREEALAILALRYFTSHGPATLQDFIWWSGLPVKDARKGLAAVAQKLASETTGEHTYWFAPSQSPVISTGNTLHFLPAFDEFMISYKDRSASLDASKSSSAITANGIFKPIILVNGKVTGLWKRTVKKDSVHIETQFFNRTGNPNKTALQAAINPYASFTGLKPVM
jgi:hypothetical protein